MWVRLTGALGIAVLALVLVSRPAPAAAPESHAALVASLLAADQVEVGITPSVRLDGGGPRKAYNDWLDLRQPMHSYGSLHTFYVSASEPKVLYRNRMDPFRYHWNGTVVRKLKGGDCYPIDEPVPAYEPWVEDVFDEAITGFASATWSVVTDTAEFEQTFKDHRIPMLVWARVEWEVAGEDFPLYLGVMPQNNEAAGKLRLLVVGDPPDGDMYQVKIDWNAEHSPRNIEPWGENGDQIPDSMFYRGVDDDEPCPPLDPPPPPP